MQMAVGSGRCSRRSLLRLVRGNASEAEEQEAALLLRTLGQHFEQHAQLSGSPLVVAAAVAVGLPSVGLAQNGAAPVCSPYPQWLYRERQVSQLKRYLHVRSAATSLQKREVLDARGWVSA